MVKSKTKRRNKSLKKIEFKKIWKKGTMWNEKNFAWYMECRGCDDEVKVTDTTVAITCWRCVNKMVPFEETVPKSYFNNGKSVGPKKPAGWHFMKEFVDADGNVYHRGKEQPKLKGTLKPTKIETKKRLTKKEKIKINDEINKQIFDLKKQHQKAKWKKDQRALEVKIRKLHRKLK